MFASFPANHTIQEFNSAMENFCSSPLLYWAIGILFFLGLVLGKDASKRCMGLALILGIFVLSQWYVDKQRNAAVPDQEKLERDFLAIDLEER